MNYDNPPPYSTSPPPPGMHPPPPQGMGQPPLQPMKPPYSSPEPQFQTAHVVINPGPATIVNFGPTPQHLICPSCHATISTDVKTEPNTKTHLFALILCLFGCYLCCCIPYCMDSCQSQNHYCPNCHSYLGVYQN